jgi:PTH1 family peptidyl-tRNA hydrolase
MTIRLIVGLCNPGTQYDQTRHNAGSWFVESLAKHHNGQWKSDAKLFGRTSKIVIGSHELLLLLPDTFMNRSGKSVAAAVNFYKLQSTQVLVVHDELDLSPGIARFKDGGGHGGHNGLRDIIPALGNKSDFLRLRIGIGHPGHAKAVSNYVLSKPDQGDKAAIEHIIHEAEQALTYVLADDLAKAMNQLHSIAVK